MVPLVSNEAEAVIALEGQGANIILVKVAISACFEDFALGFNPEVIDFIPPRNKIGRTLVAKLSANFLVST